MALTRLLLGSALVLGTLGASAAPAAAWGSYTHTWIAGRAHAVLVPRAPWLALERDAFVWGTLAADLDHLPGNAGHCRAHSARAFEALWRDAAQSRDPRALAFALGWAVHVAADDERDAAFRPDAALLSSLAAAAGTARANGSRGGEASLVDWAVDAALVPIAGDTLFDLFRASVLSVNSPFSGPLRQLASRATGTDEDAPLGWARLQAAMCRGGVDGYLEARARLLDLAPASSEALRSPKARQALGELRPVLGRAVERGIERAGELLKRLPPPAPQRPPAPSAPAPPR